MGNVWFGVFTFDEIWEGVKITLTVTAIGLEEQTTEIDEIGKGTTARVQIDIVAVRMSRIKRQMNFCRTYARGHCKLDLNSVYMLCFVFNEEGEYT